MAHQKITIGFITKWDERQSELAEITAPNHRDYCSRHGYTYICDTGAWDKSRNGMWMKHTAILRALRDPRYKDIDWFFWSDTDVLLMNYTIPLESMVVQRDDVHIIASKWTVSSGFQSYTNLHSDTIETASGINPAWFTFHTGNFFIRNCDWSYNFIRSVYTDIRFINTPSIATNMTGDEVGFTIYYLAYPEVRPHILFQPIEMFHILPEEDVKQPMVLKRYIPGDILVHASFRPLCEKIDILKRYVGLVVR
jgi:hypothetical protein